MNVQPNLSELEKSEKELYFKEYGNRPDGISLNYGIALYDIFSADLYLLYIMDMQIVIIYEDVLKI
jgi:hypothetical protein